MIYLTLCNRFPVIQKKLIARPSQYPARIQHKLSYTTTTTTTTSLFQFKYSLQSLCPQLATAIRGGYKRKKGNYIIIHIYLKRTILEAV